MIARANAESLGVNSRIDFVLADCWHRSDDRSLGQFDLIVSNPPYIAEADVDGLEPEVRQYEPWIALTPGPDGLAFYRRIAEGLLSHLTRGGSVMLELGYGQAQALREILRTAGMSSIKLIDDLAGIPRVIACAKTERF